MNSRRRLLLGKHSFLFGNSRFEPAAARRVAFNLSPSLLGLEDAIGYDRPEDSQRTFGWFYLSQNVLVAEAYKLHAPEYST